MVANAKELASLIESTLKPHGFRPKGRAWYRDSPETITVIDLQGSRWGGEYFINIGIYVKALGSATCPKESECQMRLRWERLNPNDDSLHRLFNFDESRVSPETRRQIVANCLLKHVLPFLDKAGSIDGIREVLRQTPRLENYVYASLKDFLARNNRPHS